MFPRIRQHLPLEDKMKILELLRTGMSFSAVGRLYGKNESTIRTIKRNAIRILGYDPDELEDSSSDDDDIFDNNGEKPNEPTAASAKRKRQRFTEKEKMEILDLLNTGMPSTEIAQQYGRNVSSIRTVKRNAIKIMEQTGGDSTITFKTSPSDDDNDDDADDGDDDDDDGDDDDDDDSESTKQKHKKHRRSRLPLQQKLEILNMVNNGKSCSSIARLFGKNESSIRTIKRNEKKILSKLNSSNNDTSLDESIKDIFTLDNLGQCKEEQTKTESSEMERESMEMDKDEESLLTKHEKRKRITISHEQKLEILNLLNSGKKYSTVGRMVGRNESTIRAIKRNEAKILDNPTSSEKLRKKLKKYQSSEDEGNDDGIPYTDSDSDMEPNEMQPKIEGAEENDYAEMIPIKNDPLSAKCDDGNDKNDGNNDVDGKSIAQRLKRSRSVAGMEEKLSILQLLNDGWSPAKVARKYGRNEATIRAIRRNEEKIQNFTKTATQNMEKKICYKLLAPRNEILDKSEKSLLIWMKDLADDGVSISNRMICQRAINLYIQHSAGVPKSERKEFLASRGWLKRFLQSDSVANINNLILSDGKPCAATVAVATTSKQSKSNTKNKKPSNTDSENFETVMVPFKCDAVYLEEFSRPPWTEANLHEIFQQAKLLSELIHEYDPMVERSQTIIGGIMDNLKPLQDLYDEMKEKERKPVI